MMRKHEFLTFLIALIVSGCSTNDFPQEPLSAKPMTLSELYDQKASFEGQVVTVVGRLTIYPENEPGNILKLNDLEDHRATSEYVQGIIKREMGTEAGDIHGTGSGKIAKVPAVNFPKLLIRPLNYLYSQVVEMQFSVPDIYKLETSLAEVLKDFEYECLIVSGYLFPLPQAYDSELVRYAGGLMPIGLQPCQKN